LRYTLIQYTQDGRPINFDIKKSISNRKFSNKIWQSVKFFLHYYEMMNIEEKNIIKNENLIPKTHADKYLLSKLSKLVKDYHENVEKFKFSDITNDYYIFYYNTLCDLYIEMIKPILNGKTNEDKIVTINVLRYSLEVLLKLLHPIMPFISDELYQHIPYFEKEKSLMVTQFPKDLNFNNENVENDFNKFLKIINEIRSLNEESQNIIYIEIQNDEFQQLVMDNFYIFESLIKCKKLNVLKKFNVNDEKIITSRINDETNVVIILENNDEKLIFLNKLKKKLKNLDDAYNSLLKRTLSDGYLLNVNDDIKNEHNSKLLDWKSQIIKINQILSSNII
jgi:valyl-tRNA synthetase